MLLLLILIWVVLCVCTFRMRGKRPPFADGASPIVGHTFRVIQNPEALYKLLLKLSMDCVRKGGAVTFQFVTTYIYGITDPEDANLVLNSCLQKDIIYDYFKPWIGEGLITASEHVWQKHRKLLNPTFNQVVLDSYLPEFNKQARALVQHLDTKAGRGMFNHALAIENMALQTLCSTAMGIVTDDEGKRMRQEYILAKSKFTLGLIERAQKFWLQSDFVYKYLSSLHKRQEEHAKTLHTLTNAIIKKHKAEMCLRKANAERQFKPFLELLLEMGKNGAFTDEEVMEEVDTFTFAGSDTVSVALTIALLAVASMPEIQRKVFEELWEVFKGSEKDVEKQDLAQLKYLDAVIKESMRLYPTVPVVGRTIHKDLKIKNYTLPAGSRCFVSLYGVNRDPVWGPDVEEFRPERWLDPASLPSHAFASFGLGRRKCIGYNYAMISMKTALAHVLRRYRVSGDISLLEQTIEVVGRPVPKDYISIERRVKTEYVG